MGFTKLSKSYLHWRSRR